MTASNARTSAATNTVERELVITRVFDAPRSLVFQVWTDPKHVAQWWGPHGFTNPVCELDVRHGGAIRIHMRGPDGTVYPMTGVYQEIVEPERLVFTSAALDKEGNPLFEVLNTVTFVEENGKTTQTLQARVVKTTVGAAPYLEGMNEGWRQTLERLEALVAARKNHPTEKPAERDIAITRVFDAPRSLVFKAWTVPEHLIRWWAPKGFTTPFCKVNLCVGGVFHYCMRSPEGQDIWGIGVYREIVAPERIVYTDAFADAEGNPVPPAHYGMSASHPAETLVTVTFAEHVGKTKLTLRHSISESVKERGGAEQGWTEMMDRLAEHLAQA